MGMKEAYQEKADAQLREWRAWIDNYRSVSRSSFARSAAERQRVMDRLEAFHHVACGRLEDLRLSQEEHWEFAKQAVERAMIDLKRALDESGAATVGRIVEVQANRSYIYDPFERKG